MTVTKIPRLPPPPEFSKLRTEVASMSLCDSCEGIRGKQLKTQLKVIDLQTEQLERIRAKATLGKPPVIFLDWVPKIPPPPKETGEINKDQNAKRTWLERIQQSSITWKELIGAEEKNLKEIKDMALGYLNMIKDHCSKPAKPLPSRPSTPRPTVPSLTPHPSDDDEEGL